MLLWETWDTAQLNQRTNDADDYQKMYSNYSSITTDHERLVKRTI